MAHGQFFFSKFIPGLNPVIILFSGIFRIKSYIVYLSFISAAIIHNTGLVLIGRFLGNNIDSIKQFIRTYNIIVVCLILVVLLVLFVFSKRRRYE